MLMKYGPLLWAPVLKMVYEGVVMNFRIPNWGRILGDHKIYFGVETGGCIKPEVRRTGP